jgi:hypothetical protein
MLGSITRLQMQHIAIQDCQLQSEDDGWKYFEFSCHDSLYEDVTLIPDLNMTESLFNTSSFKSSALHEQLPNGLVIDQYRLVERIGCGSFGAAYRAQDMCRRCEVRTEEVPGHPKIGGSSLHPLMNQPCLIV